MLRGNQLISLAEATDRRDQPVKVASIRLAAWFIGSIAAMATLAAILMALI